MTMPNRKSQNHQHYCSEKLSEIPKTMYNFTSLNLINVITTLNSKPVKTRLTSKCQPHL